MQNLTASKANFLATQQLCSLPVMSSTPTSSTSAANESATVNDSLSRLNGNNTITTSSGFLDNQTMEQLENFQQLLSHLDPSSLQTSIYLNQLASSVSNLVPTTSTTVASNSSLVSSNHGCNTSPKSTTTTNTVNNLNTDTGDYVSAAAALQQQLMETLMQSGNGTSGSLASAVANSNLFSTIANSANNNFIDLATELLMNGGGVSTDAKPLSNGIGHTSITNNNNANTIEEVNSDGLASLMTNLISNGELNAQQWEELNNAAVVVLNNNSNAVSQNTTSSSLTAVAKLIKQQQQQYTSTASASIGQQSRNSSPAPTVMEQQLLSLLNNVSPAELLSALTSTNNTSNPNLAAVAATAGLTSSQIASAAAQMFSAVAGNNDLSSLLSNAANNLNSVQSNGSRNSMSDNSATAAAVASLLAASGSSFSFNGSPSKSLDSYCEICDKNLCNRYFLKTHKLKKHGISDDGTAGSPVKTTSSLFSQNNLENNENIGLNYRSAAPPGKNEAKMESEIIDGDSEGPRAKMPKLSLTSNASTSNAAALLGLSATSKVADNNNSTSLFGGKSPLDFLNVAEQFQKQTKLAGFDDTNSSAAVVAAAAAAMFDSNNGCNGSSFACDICNKDFDSQINLIQHKCTQHAVALLSSALAASGNGGDSPQSSSSSAAGSEIGANNNTGNSSFLSSLSQLPFFLPPEVISHLTSGEIDPQIALAALAKLSNGEAGLSLDANFAGNSSGATSSKSGTPKRQYTSTSKNYCDLCNKEVCNKYFLRTHMLKMHQIVIDENKPIIAKIDTTEKEKTGAISFRCDVCLMEMKTRQDLRQHKTEVHGVLSHSVSANTTRSITPISRTPKSTFQGTPTHKISSASLDSAITKSQYLCVSNSGTFEDNNSENDEKNIANFTPKVDEDEDRTNNNNNNNNNNIKPVTLPSEVEHLINTMAAASSRQEKLENKKENSENDIGESVPSSSASSATSETNASSTSTIAGNVNPTLNNDETSERCRYCGDYFPTSSKMQQHAIEEHSEEILKQFAAAAALENSGVDHQQLVASLENEELITQVAMQMQQANQQQQQVKKTHCANLISKSTEFTSSSSKDAKPFRTSYLCGKCNREFLTNTECSLHIMDHNDQRYFINKSTEKIESPTSAGSTKEIFGTQNNESAKIGHDILGVRSFYTRDLEKTSEDNRMYIRYTRAEKYDAQEDIPDNSTTNDDDDDDNDEVNDLPIRRPLIIYTGQEIACTSSELSSTTSVALKSLEIDNRSNSIEQEEIGSQQRTEVDKNGNNKMVCSLNDESPKGYPLLASSAESLSPTQKFYPLQTFKIRCTEQTLNGNLLNEMTVYLPVKKIVDTPFEATIELIPELEHDSKIYHL